jgi:hypothetical protein
MEQVLHYGLHIYLSYSNSCWTDRSCKLINWMFFLVLNIHGTFVCIIMDIIHLNPILTSLTNELACVSDITYSHYEIIGLFQNLIVYIIVFLFVTFLARKSDIIGLKNGHTAITA